MIMSSSDYEITHVFFSPHMDDAIGSCGGTIAKLANAGSLVFIYNLFSGKTTPPYSPAAIDLHNQWGNPKDVVELRRAEDQAACTKIGVKVHFDNIPDAIYRISRNGKWMYGNDDDIFKDRHKDDEKIVKYFEKRIRKYLSNYAKARLYFPLGVGNHVDHKLAFDIGLLLKADDFNVWFYEDFPYTKSKDIVPLMFASRDWYSYSVSLTINEINAKICAFNYYLSQVSMLFGSSEKMRDAFITFAKEYARDEVEFAERFWSYR